MGKYTGAARILIPLFILCLSIYSFGETVHFTGKVTDTSNTPVKGAVVMLKSSGLQTTSDVNGLYDLNNNSTIANEGSFQSRKNFGASIIDRTVAFTLYNKETVSIGIYTLSGSLVRRVLPNQVLFSGCYRFRIAATGEAQGLYLVKLQIGSNATILKYNPLIISKRSILQSGTAMATLSKRMSTFADTIICQKNGLMSSFEPVTSPSGTVNFTLSPRSFNEFSTGQNAQIVLNAPGFNNSGYLQTPGDGLLFNHPGNISTDGTHFLLADTRNNRVLIWNKLPKGNVSPDIVLGQTNLTSNNTGTGLGSMNWPSDVSIGNGKIVVADSYNHRILVWNSLPTTNGQPADFAIVNNLPAGNPGSGFSGCWPWALWTDGTKLVVTATQSSSVLIWNSFPTGDVAPGFTLTGKEPGTGTPVFGTPRSIGTDGATYLMIGDHNSYPSLGGTSGNFFWSGFPTSDQPWSFMLHNYGLNHNSSAGGPPGIIWGGQKVGNKLVALAQPVIGIWDSLPAKTDQLYNSFVGCGNGFDLDPPVSEAGYRFTPNEYGGLQVTSSGVLYTSFNFENMVAGYNSFPTSPTQLPDFAVGSTDININPYYNTYHYFDNPVPATNGTILLATSSLDRKLAIWNNIPTINSVTPDTFYDLGNRQLKMSALCGSKFVAAGLDGVTNVVNAWTSLPPKSGTPDINYSGKIGSVNFGVITGVALDNKYLYVSDQTSQRVYVWSALPATTDEPQFSISIPSPANICSDGTYLVVSYCNLPDEFGCKIYKVDGLSATSSPVATLPAKDAAYAFAPPGPTSVLVARNHLFLSDVTSGRILVWTSIDSAIALKNPDVVLGQTSLTKCPLTEGLAQNRLFWPAQMAFDGCWLWVGEFKFSGRLVAF